MAEAGSTTRPTASSRSVRPPRERAREALAALRRGRGPRPGRRRAIRYLALAVTGILTLLVKIESRP